jgi:hypothetical protein
MQKVGEWRISFVCSMAHNPQNPGSLNRRNERTRGPKSGAALISMHGALSWHAKDWSDWRPF